MPAKSKQQQKFMGIVRAIQKGDEPASKFSKDAQDAADDMKKKDVEKFASTKHKGLPKKVEQYLRQQIRKSVEELLKKEDYVETCGYTQSADGKKLKTPGATGEEDRHLKEQSVNEDVYIGYYKNKKVKITAKTDKEAHRQIISKLKIPKRDYDRASVQNLTKTKKNIHKFESMNPSAVKKMRDEFEKTGQLPPHLKKFAKDLNAMKKKHKVKNIVVPGLEWMSDMKEQSVDEAKYKVHMRDKKRGNFELEKFQTGGQSYDYKKGMDIVKKLRKMSGSLEYKLVKESINENRDFEKLYNLFTKKDYFNLKNSIKQMLRNYDVALKKGDKGAQKYTKQDVIKSVTAQNKENAKRVYDELVTAIKKKDIRRLKSRLRYNQPYSIAIFNQTTGKKLPKNTRDIQSFLDNEFMKESVNEASVSQVRSTLSRVKKQLMKKWAKKGGYENFGQKELRALKSKFKENPYGSPQERQISKMLDAFDNWAMNYSGDMSESINEARLDPKQTIQQLGGNRFLYMVGAKNLAIDKPRNELHMKIMRNAKGVSHVVIKLTSLDLYDMKFLSIRAGKIRVKAKEKGVYGDQLATFFKKHTGLNTRL